MERRRDQLERCQQFTQEARVGELGSMQQCASPFVIQRRDNAQELRDGVKQFELQVLESIILRRPGSASKAVRESTEERLTLRCWPFAFERQLVSNEESNGRRPRYFGTKRRKVLDNQQRRCGISSHTLVTTPVVGERNDLTHRPAKLSNLGNQGRVGIVTKEYERRVDSPLLHMSFGSSPSA